MIAFFQYIFTQLSGGIGIALIGCLLVLGIVESIQHKSMRPFIASLIGGGAFYAIPWIMANVMAAAGG